MSAFYEGLRWEGWEKDISEISYDKGVNFYPPLWSEQGAISSSSRRSVSLKELWVLKLQYIEKFK